MRWERVGYTNLPPRAVSNGAELVLNEVQREDAGLYRCIATNSLGIAYAQVSLIVLGGFACTHSFSLAIHFIQLHVYFPCTTEPPTIVVDRQIKQVSVGARVALTCTSSSVPPPRFSWSKAGGALPRYGNIVQQLPTYEPSIS